MIQRIKGTQDFLDLTLFNFLITKAKQHFNNANFTEIATPLIEPVELFKRSLGLETDVVTKEMYTLTSASLDTPLRGTPDYADPGLQARQASTGRRDERVSEVICLRPEATASTMRAFLQAHIDQTPWKVYTYGPMFRHERPQKGRFRQFHQISLEIINTHSITQDALFIALLDRFFGKALMLDTYALLLNFLGCPQDRVTFKQVLHVFLEQHINALCPTCVERKEKNILRVFDCKNAACQELYKQAPKTTEHLCPACASEWSTLQTLLQKLSISFSCLPTLVRGLDYYDKTVFEFVSTDLGAQNAFCGGGRYDGLAEQLGAPMAYPSIGAAIGIERVMLMLEAIKDKLPLPQPKALHVIIPVAVEQQASAVLLADQLLTHDLCVTVLEGGSLKNMMKKANKLGAKNALIIGEDEQRQGVVTIKNMVTGEEQKVRQTEALKHV